MFFQILKRYPLLSRLTLMLACLSILSYTLFISAGLYARLESAADLGATPSLEGQLSAIRLIQILLGLLFVMGCGLTLRKARQSLMERTDLALSRSPMPEAGAENPLNAGRDEVDRLALALETLAAGHNARLADVERSAQQARAQERMASRSLEFIYRTGLHLTENNVSGPSMKVMLEDMADSLRASNCTLALLEPVAEGIGVPPLIGIPAPAALLEQYATAELSRDGLKRTLPGAEGEMIELAVPVRDAADSYGVLIVNIRADLLFESRQSQAVDTVAGLIALSLGNLLRNQRRRRLALMDERNAIAGELHDSLAQALAYMKIQVTRLQKELDRSCSQCGTRENFKINEVSAEIKTGLDSAYRHLRELLTAFRTNMPPGGLQQALREVVDELAARAGTDINLEYRLGKLSLSVNEEFHVLQIVREALTNVVRHARARNTTVSLDVQSSGELRVAVSDDGRGALGDTDKEGHYGLSIMQDRAVQLGGTLDIAAASEDGRGTRVQLSFMPRSQQG